MSPRPECNCCRGCTCDEQPRGDNPGILGLVLSLGLAFVLAAISILVVFIVGCKFLDWLL